MLDSIIQFLKENQMLVFLVIVCCFLYKKREGFANEKNTKESDDSTESDSPKRETSTPQEEVPKLSIGDLNKLKIAIDASKNVELIKQNKNNLRDKYSTSFEILRTMRGKEQKILKHAKKTINLLKKYSEERNKHLALKNQIETNKLINEKILMVNRMILEKKSL